MIRHVNIRFFTANILIFKKSIVGILILANFLILNAATKTWTNGNGNWRWTTNTNWSGNTIPVAGDDIIIPAGFNNTITRVPTLSINSLNVASTVVLSAITTAKTLTINNTNGTSALTISGGSSLQMGDGIATNAVNLTFQNINTATVIDGTLTVAANTTITLNGASTLNATGTITGAGTVTVATTGTIIMGGTFTPTTFNRGTGTFEYNGGDQNITAFTYNVLNCTGWGTKFVQPNVTVNSNLTVPLGVTVAIRGNLSVLGNVSVDGQMQFDDATARTVSVTGNFTGNGILKMDNNGSAHILNVGGAINSIGSFTGGTAATVNYNRNGDQTLFIGNYNNLTLNTTASCVKSLSGDIFINGILALNANTLLGLGIFDLTLGASGSITGSSATSYIRTDGNGTFIKQGTTTANFIMTYPVGSNGYYTPMQITALTASVASSGSISVRVVPAQRQASTNALVKYWNVLTSGISLTNTDINFSYNDNETSGSVGNDAGYNIRRFDGTSFQTPEGAVVNTATNSISSTASTNISGDWTAIGTNVAPANILYSYQNGSWASASTWTIDPSGTLWNNPSSLTPGATVTAVILNGRNVYFSANSQQAGATEIRYGGVLDCKTFTALNLGTVSGEGLLRINSTTFPSGQFSNFTALGGGTVEYYNLGATVNLPSQAVYNNLLISNSTGTNHTITLTNTSLATNYIINGNFTLQKLGAGALNFVLGNVATNIIYLTIFGNTNIGNGCSVLVGNFNAMHKIECWGNFTNNGTVRFTNQASPVVSAYYTNPVTTTGAAWVTFKGATNNTLTCNNITDFYRFIIDKGSDQTYMLDVNVSAAGNFAIYGPNNQGGYWFETPCPSKAVYLANGTLRLNKYADIPSLSEGGQDFNLPSTACLWVNGAVVSSTASGNGTGWQAATLYGRLRVSDGSFSTETSAAVVLGTLGTPEIIVEGTGILDVGQMWNAAGGGATNRISYIQTGGTTNIRLQSENHAGPTIGLQNPYTVFNMSGGVMNIYNNQFIDNNYQYNIADIQAAPGNFNITGGTININVPGSATAYTFKTTVPFYNLNVSNQNATGTVTLQFLNNTDNTISVLNDLTLNAGTLLDMGTNTIALKVARNFTINTGAVYTPGTNTTVFNGNAINGQLFTISGTITGGALNNFTLDNTSNTTLANNLTVNGTLTIGSGCYLQDNGKTLSAIGNIVNNGTLTSQVGGSITITGSASQTIGGSGAGIFGNLFVDKTTGSATFTASQRVTGDVRLINGILDINRYNLTITGNVYDAITGVSTTGFSASKMIQTSGLSSDGGVTKVSSVAGKFIYPLGCAAKYTPVRFTLSQPLTGNVTVKPVNEKCLMSTSANVLNYSYIVTTSGLGSIAPNSINLVFKYINSDVVGNEALYVPAIYNPYAWNNLNDISLVDRVNDSIKFLNMSSIGGEYAVGEPTAFSTVTAYYSKNSTDWGLASTWVTGSFAGSAAATPPTANNPVIIGNNCTVTAEANGKICGSLEIQSTGTLDLGTTTGHNFGNNPQSIVGGTGLLLISSNAATATFPGGDFGNFLSENGGTVQYYTTGATNFAIPNTSGSYQLLTYKNLTLAPASGRIITLPDMSSLSNQTLTIFNNFTINGTTATGIVQTQTTGVSTYYVKGIMNVTGGVFQFNNQFAQTLVLDSNLLVSSTNGAEINVADANNIVTNAIFIKGNLQNNNIFNIGNTAGSRYANITFNGNLSKTLSGTGATTRFQDININKGSDRTTILTVTSTAFTINGNLNLNYGELQLNRAAATDFPNSPFTIPYTTCLSLLSNSLTLCQANNDNDVLLSGRLEVLGGTLDIGNTANIKHNDIEYSSAGTPEIYISGGNLNVAGQIRRNTQNTLGALNYYQLGGAVTIYGLNQDATRAKFEITNSGSYYYSTGGVITIVRAGGTTYGDVYLQPENYVVNGTNGGNNLQFGNTNTPAGTVFQLNSSVPLWDITVDGTTTSKTVFLNVNPLTLYNSLIINGSASKFNANGFNVNIGKNLVNNNTSTAIGTDAGGFQPGSTSQTITFNGSSAQLISGTGTNVTNLANLAISNNLTLSANTILQVNGDLMLNSGTFNDGGNTVTVTGNFSNNAIHTSPSGVGINMAGTQKQYISGSGTGQFGNLRVNNTAGVDITDNMQINGTLNINNGILYIDDYLLTLGINATVTGTFSSTNMIRLNGTLSDGGVNKQYPASNYSFTYPIGVHGYYNPVSLNVANTPTTSGSITVRIYNNYHPVDALPNTDQLNLYWNVSSTGLTGAQVTHIYNYNLPQCAGGSNASFVGARYVGTPTYTWASGIGTPSGTMLTITNANYIDGDYTLGLAANFVTTPVLYTRNALQPAGANWNNPLAWTTNADGSDCTIGCTGGGYNTAPLGNPVIINSGHTINMSANSALAQSVLINGTLNLNTTTFHDLGFITTSGPTSTGKMQLTATTDGMYVFPGGNYDGFMNVTSSTVELTSNGANAATLPLKPGNYYKPFQNLVLNGAGTKNMSAENLKILGNITINSGKLSNSEYNKNLSIGGDWTNNVVNGFEPGTGEVIFNGTSVQNITSSGTETFNSLYNNNTGSGLNVVSGLLTINNNLYLNNVITTTSALYLANTGSNVLFGSSYVNGPLKKAMLNGSSFNFPVGNTPRSGSTLVSNVNVAGDYEIQYYNQDPALNAPALSSTSKVVPLDVVSNVEYWRIIGPAASSAVITLRWDALSAIIPPDPASSRSKLRVSEWNGAAWQRSAASSVLSLGNTQVAGTLQTPSSIAIGNSNKYFTIGVESLPTAIINAGSSTNSFCFDGTQTASIAIDLTGTPPWSLTYTVNNANATIINNIAVTPYNLVVGQGSPGITAAGTYAYRVAAVSDATGSSGIRDFTTAYNVIALVAPTPSISGLTTLPLNQNTNYLVTNVALNTYSWTISGNGTINSGANTNTANVTFTSGATGWVQLTQTNTTTLCVVTTPQFAITLTDVPNPVISGNNSVCINISDTYQTANVPGHTYVWSLPLGGGTITTGGATAIVTVNWTSVGNYKLQVSETGSVTVNAQYDVQVNPLPLNTPTVANENVCSGNAVTLQIVGAEPGTDYFIYDGATQMSTVHTTTAGTYNFAAFTPTLTTTYSVTASANNCVNTLTATPTVTVNQQPLITIGGATQTTCSTNSILFTGVTVTGSNGINWTITTGTGSFNNATLDNPTYTPTLVTTDRTDVLKIDVTALPGCNNISSTKNIIIYQTPNTSTINHD